MKITDVIATVLRQPAVEMTGDGSQDTVVIEIKTDAGISGYGEVDSAPFLVKQMIDMPSSHEICRGMKEILIGKDPFDNRVISSELYETTYYYGRHGAAIHAISGIDMALWDIKGKALGVPAYKLLGGNFRKDIPAYCSALVPETEDEIKKLLMNKCQKDIAGSNFPGELLVRVRKKILSWHIFAEKHLARMQSL